MKMKTILMLSAISLASVFVLGPKANANLLGNGDFENSSADINAAEFVIGDATKGDTGEWYALSPWMVTSGGPSGSSYYFDHTGGGGSDQRAFQPVDTSSMSLAGSDITLSFDYLFDSGDWQIQNMGVALVGLSGTGAQYVAFGGAGYDGFFGGTDVAIARNVLGSTSLDPTGKDTWGHYSLTATIDQNYDVIIAVFASSAWNLLGSDSGMRGIDNVSMDVSSVPEPATMLLFGTCIAGLAGTTLRKKKSA